MAKGLYIVPVLFAYTPLLSGDWPAMLQVFGFAVVGIYAISASLQGCMEKPFGIAMRKLSLLAGIACLWPAALIANIAGVIAVFGLLAWNVRHGQAVAPSSDFEAFAPE